MPPPADPPKTCPASPGTPAKLQSGRSKSTSLRVYGSYVTKLQVTSGPYFEEFVPYSSDHMSLKNGEI